MKQAHGIFSRLRTYARRANSSDEVGVEYFFIFFLSLYNKETFFQKNAPHIFFKIFNKMLLWFAFFKNLALFF